MVIQITRIKPVLIWFIKIEFNRTASVMMPQQNPVCNPIENHCWPWNKQQMCGLLPNQTWCTHTPPIVQVLFYSGVWVQDVYSINFRVTGMVILLCVKMMQAAASSPSLANWPVNHGYYLCTYTWLINCKAPCKWYVIQNKSCWT